MILKLGDKVIYEDEEYIVTNLGYSGPHILYIKSIKCGLEKCILTTETNYGPLMKAMREEE